MFAYNGGDLPSLHCYADAFRCWDNATQWRDSKREWDGRKLDGNKRHITIRKGNNGQIICRMHSTDVVVYHTDGSIHVDCSYGSRSTDEFIWGLLRGSGIHCRTNERKPVAWVRHDGGYHFVTDTAKFIVGIDGFKLDNPETIYTYASKPAVVKQVLTDYGYGDFIAWRKMYLAMQGEPQTNDWRGRNNPKYRPNTMHSAEVMQALRDGGENCGVLANRCSEDYVRTQLLRRHPEIVAVAEREPFNDERDYQNWKALDRKYGWAVKGY